MHACAGHALGASVELRYLAVPFDELARRVRDGELSLRSCRAFLLDEYVGLPAGHPESYRTVIEREFVARTDIAPEAVHGPDGGAADVPGACAAYEEALREAGAEVVGVATVVDRATGADDVIRAEGVEYRALLGLADLGLE